MAEEYAHALSSLAGSDGKKGWPVAVKDRLAYFSEGHAACSNVAVTFLWTVRDAVIPKLSKENLALAANFYTPAGLEGMVRNMLGNPCIRYLIMFGNESSSQSTTDKTSANAIRAFFGSGLGADGKLPGFESAVHLDCNIPMDAVDELRKGVELIDLNSKMPGASLEEKVSEANRLMASLERKEPFALPRTFGYEESEASFPFEGGPMLVHGETIPKAWVEMVHNIYRYGRDNLMNANTDRWVKEINNMVVTVHNPQDMDLGFNPFLVPLTKEKIEAYQREILSSELPAGKAYTYGNKLRAYSHAAADEVRDIVGSREYKDFEFGRGPHLDANVKYSGGRCEINQVKDIIDVLKRDMYSKACIGITWHVQDELMRKHKSSPCLVLIQAMVQDEALNLTVMFRSHDMVQGWPENAYGCAAIQKEIADAIGAKAGLLTIISGSAQIYRHYYQQVREMLEKHRKPGEWHADPRGNFLIEVKEGAITASHVHPETGKVLESFSGTGAKEIYSKVAFSTSGLQPEHLLYLGSELQKAELALKKCIPYQQDKELGL